MLYIIFNNQTKLIVSTRFDNSTPQPLPAEFWFNDFVNTRNVSASEYTIAVHPDSNAQVLLGRDKYDADTKTISVDPDWVMPVSLRPQVTNTEETTQA